VIDVGDDGEISNVLQTTALVLKKEAWARTQASMDARQTSRV